MKLEDRKRLVTELGVFLQNLTNHNFEENSNGIVTADYEDFYEKIDEASYKNSWFLKENIESALKAWAINLTTSNINLWLSKYEQSIKDSNSFKTVAIVMAGNIPLVGFHDLLCVFLSGHKALCKLSSNDQILLPAIVKILTKLNSEISNAIEITLGRLVDFDAVIATGSNNTSRYFEYYFGKYPNIIRKNRNSVAILDGKETQAELQNLGFDIFQYFGLGCRNVSKLFVPQNYDFTKLFEAIQSFEKVQFQSKYMNNYDFNKSIYLVNKVAHFDNGFLLLKEDNRLVSPISVIYYEYYKDQASLFENLESRKDEIQCMVGKFSLDIDNVGFGKTQNPKLLDYADRLDTLNFLIRL